MIDESDFALVGIKTETLNMQISDINKTGSVGFFYH